MSWMGNTSLEAIIVYKALKTAIQEPMIGFEEPGAPVGTHKVLLMGSVSWTEASWSGWSLAVISVSTG